MNCTTLSKAGLAALLLAAATLAQTDPSSRRAESRDTESRNTESRAIADATAGDRKAPTVSDPAALALFRKAAIDQTPGDPDFRLKDLQVDLVASFFERGEDGKRRPRTADVVEFWRAATVSSPERYRRDLYEPTNKKQTIHGFDGNVYWEKLGDAAARELRGAEDKDTRKQLQIELSRLNDLAAALILRRLDTPDAVFTFAAGAPTSLKINGRETAVTAVLRTAPNRKDETFYFSEKDFGPGRGVRTVLSGFRRAKSGKNPDELMTFGVHVETGAGQGRLVAPLVVETFEDGELVLQGSVREASLLKVNVGLEDVLFAPALR